MNERIRELMVKANRLAEENYNTLNGPYYNWTEIQGEKFAELIIKNCIDEIHAADVGNLHAKGYHLDKVAEHIENHFGIKDE